MYYSLPGKEAAPPIRAALKWVDLSLAEEQAAADAKRLKQVLKIDPPSYAESSAANESPFPLHRKLLPQPDGRGLGAPSEG